MQLNGSVKQKLFLPNGVDLLYAWNGVEHSSIRSVDNKGVRDRVQTVEDGYVCLIKSRTNTRLLRSDPDCRGRSRAIPPVRCG